MSYQLVAFVLLLSSNSFGQALAVLHCDVREVIGQAVGNRSKEYALEEAIATRDQGELSYEAKLVGSSLLASGFEYSAYLSYIPSGTRANGTPRNADSVIQTNISKTQGEVGATSSGKERSRVQLFSEGHSVELICQLKQR